MCAWNTPQLAAPEGGIQDFDGVSLYPSAMVRGYYPAGKPRCLTPDEIAHWNNPENLMAITESPDSQVTLFMTVMLFDCRRVRAFPLLSVRHGEGTEGVRMFLNNFNDRFFLSHVALQDAINFQGYSYRIESGLIFERRSFKVQEVIRNLFEKRRDLKRAGNQAQ